MSVASVSSTELSNPQPIPEVQVYQEECTRLGCKANSYLIRYLEEPPADWEDGTFDVQSNLLPILLPMCPVFRSHPGLCQVFLKSSGIKNETLVGLCKVFREAHSRTLRELDISGNVELSIPAGQALMETVRQCPALYFVRMGGTNIAIYQQKAIHNSCDANFDAANLTRTAFFRMSTAFKACTGPDCGPDSRCDLKEALVIEAHRQMDATAVSRKQTSLKPTFDTAENVVTLVNSAPSDSHDASTWGSFTSLPSVGTLSGFVTVPGIKTSPVALAQPHHSTLNRLDQRQQSRILQQIQASLAGISKSAGDFSLTPEVDQQDFVAFHVQNCEPEILGKQLRFYSTLKPESANVLAPAIQAICTAIDHLDSFGTGYVSVRSLIEILGKKDLKIPFSMDDVLKEHRITDWVRDAVNVDEVHLMLVAHAVKLDLQAALRPVKRNSTAPP